MEKKPPQPDNDLHKGAVEDDTPVSNGPHDDANTSMRGQLGHRNQDEMLKSSDSDFPEPGGNPEHSGEKGGASDGQAERLPPGNSQKESQNWKKEDPLAS